MLGTILRNSVFDDLSHDMDRLFGAVNGPARPALAAPGTGIHAAWPGMNVWRDGERIVAEAEIPGYRIDDIEVMVSSDGLTIRGQRESTAHSDRATPLRVERSINRFERSLTLPVEVDADGVTASLSDGVLRVEMPVAATARSRRVQVRALGSGQTRSALPSGTERAPEPEPTETAGAST